MTSTRRGFIAGLFSTAAVSALPLPGLKPTLPLNGAVWHHDWVMSWDYGPHSWDGKSVTSPSNLLRS